MASIRLGHPCRLLGPPKCSLLRQCPPEPSSTQVSDVLDSELRTHEKRVILRAQPPEQRQSYPRSLSPVSLGCSSLLFAEISLFIGTSYGVYTY